MAELIDKEAVIEIITEKCLDCNAVVCTKCKVAAMQMKIEALNTVEAEPVRHGHWIEKLTTIQCSNCGKEYNDEIRCMCYGEDAELKRCPRCGAKVEEKE